MPTRILLNSVQLRRALYGAGVIVSVLVVAALARTLYRDGPAALAAWRSADVRGTWIALALACGVTGHALNVLGWHRLLRDASVPLSLWDTTQLFVISNLGRYLPGGKAWQLGIVGVLAKERGLAPGIVSATALFQGLLGVAVGAVLLFVFAGATLQVHAVWLVLALSGLAVLMIAPAALRLAPNVRALLVQRVPALESITNGTMWMLIWTAGAGWIIWGIGLYALGVALLPSAGASLVAYITAWIGPFLFGLLAVLAPAGLGAREELMKNVLSAAGLRAGDAVMIMVMARMWVTALDVIPAIAVLTARRARRPAAQPNKPTSSE